MAAKRDKKEKTEKSNRNNSNDNNLKDSNARQGSKHGEEEAGNSQTDSCEESQQSVTDSAGNDAGDMVTHEKMSSEEKLAEMQDRYLRLSAEFDNYRKRTLKEKIDLTKSASESVMVRLLPLMDDFERGITHIDSAADTKALKEGMELIYAKFRSFFDHNGIKEIEALNKEFDVDLHDAVTKVAVSDDNMKGKVVDIVQKGYMLNDKVIRFSKVVVGE